jgi:hypothetical protein
MINYDKLKTAHELAFKLCQQTGMRVDVSIACVGDSEYIDYILIDYESEDEDLFSTVDGLIQELTKRIKPEPKHKVGDEVWYLDVPINEIYLSQVLKVRDREYVVDGDTNGTKSDFIESELYPTKEALIAAQIAHWQSLSEPEECQHEPNGQTSLIGYPEAYKCKKCMVYYR